jgi:hypothetical protein
MDLTFKLEDVLRGGLHREFFQDIGLLYGERSIKIDRKKEIGIAYGISQNELTKSNAIELVNNDVLIEHWPIGILAPAEILELEVSDGLPNSQTEDEETENLVPVKFKKWGNQPLHEKNDGTMVLLRGNLSGATLSSNEWKKFVNKSPERSEIMSQLPNNSTLEVLGPIEINSLLQQKEWANDEI